MPATTTKMGTLSLPLFLIAIQFAFIVLFGIFVQYDHVIKHFPAGDVTKPADDDVTMTLTSEVVDVVVTDADAVVAEDDAVDIVEGIQNSSNLTMSFMKVDVIRNSVQKQYGLFQDVHVMLFIGFGFLMSFLKRYGYSSVTFNLLVAAFAIQWALLTNGWILNFQDNVIKISMTTILKAEFAAAAVLVSFGAILGKLNPLQMVVMALVEVVIYQCNELLMFRIFQASDVGGSMLVHLFGAYFGLMVALFTARPGDVQTQSYKELSVYHSDLFTMIGTIFLWLFWPSFNSVFAEGEGHYRAVVNTYLALSASAIVAIAMSAIVQKNKRLTMIHVQNATLAGGVALGSMADMMVHPWAALLTGALAGGLSVLGYQFITPCCNQKMKIHDTRGVHNLHGLPALISAVGAIICTAVARRDVYGESFNQIFPAVASGSRSIEEQAEFQLAALAATLALAIGGGVLTGFLLRLPIWNQPKGAEIMDDWDYWVLPSDGYPIIPNTVNAPPIYKLPEQAAMIENNA